MQSEYESNETKTYGMTKSITALLVVIAHSTVMYTSYGAFMPLNNSNLLAMLTEYIYQFHMPLFIFVSGAIYAICIEKGKYADNAKFLLNKVKRLLIPFFAFGFLYVAPAMRWLGLTSQSYLEYCYWGILLSKNSRHLWYLGSLFWIYILAMLAKRMVTESPRNRLILLCLSAILFYSSRFVPNYMELYSACIYQLYFFCGACFHYSYNPIIAFLEKHKLICFSLPGVLLFSLWFNPNTITDLCYQFIGMAMTLALSHYIVQKRESILYSAWYKCISKNTFGIYLFHPMIIYTLYHFLGGYDINPYLLSFTIAILAVVVSVCATQLMRKLHLNILIGEYHLSIKQSAKKAS